MHTIFEISPFSPDLRDLIFRSLLGALMLYAAFAWLKSTRATEGPAMRWTSPVLLALIAVTWTAIHVQFLLEGERATYRLLQAYRAGHASIAEGDVFVKHEQPYDGHSEGDVVQVGPREFHIDYFRTTPGYGLTIAHGGVLHFGVYTRVTYIDSVIVKIEVRK